MRHDARRWWAVGAATLAMVSLADIAPAGAASSSAVAQIARYAFETAQHHRPAQVVSPLDLSNAVQALHATGSVAQVNLSVPLGGVPAWPRLAAFIDAVTFRTSCVDFPAVVGHAPRVVTCPVTLSALWIAQESVLQDAQRAIAAAASRGRGVSGADVAAAARRNKQLVSPVPSFAPGAGGTLRFVTPASISGGRVVTLSACVRFAPQAYAIPVVVNCAPRRS